MGNSIENILSAPDKSQQIEYKTMNTTLQGYDSLINTITGGGNKNNQTTKKNILNKNQILVAGETREKNRAEKRK